MLTVVGSFGEGIFAEGSMFDDHRNVGFSRMLCSAQSTPIVRPMRCYGYFTRQRIRPGWGGRRCTNLVRVWTVSDSSAGVQNGKVHVCREVPCTHVARMETVVSVQFFPVPEQVKIVNEGDTK